ncbi:Hypothetical predicted protein [Pelobates cultripes]|uniref:Uncharacterized protein n=1 Tax=Pelobates cultripes TaxID=61616 RepID=A0AAD1RVD8_PELCU|nr:Hypothetical predicted protein [Pelobates cultripes]
MGKIKSDSPRTAGSPRWQSQSADSTDPRDRPANHPKRPQAPAGDHDRTDKRRETRRNLQGASAAWNTLPHPTKPLRLQTPRSSSPEHHYQATGMREHRRKPHVETSDSTCTRTTAANFGSTRNYELQKQYHRTNLPGPQWPQVPSTEIRYQLTLDALWTLQWTLETWPRPCQHGHRRYLRTHTHSDIPDNPPA